MRRTALLVLLVVAALLAATTYFRCADDRWLMFQVSFPDREGYRTWVPISRTATLEVEYIHSVERVPVWDIIAVDDDGFYAKWSLLPDFGAGLPAQASVEVATIAETGTMYKVVVTGQRRFDHLTYLMIPLNRYHFYVDGKLVLAPEVKTTGRVDIWVRRGCFPWLPTR